MLFWLIVLGILGIFALFAVGAFLLRRLFRDNELDPEDGWSGK